MLRKSSASAVQRRTCRSACMLLSVVALGCTASAEAPDTQAAKPTQAGQGLTQNDVTVTPAVNDATRATLDVSGTAPTVAAKDDDEDEDAGVKVEQTDGGYVVTLPGLPPFVIGDQGPRIVDVTRTDLTQGGGSTSSSGPRVVDVTRTDVSHGSDAKPGAGPSVVGVTRTDHTAGATGSGPASPFDGEVVVKEGKDETVITVPGFPAITLKPDGHGAMTVTMAGSPPFTLPKGTVIEAPGGIRIEK